MIRRPSRSNRTYTLFPYSTPFRPPRVAPLSSDRAPSGRQSTDRLPPRAAPRNADLRALVEARRRRRDRQRARASARKRPAGRGRSEEHTSELQSLMRISYAVFCLKKKKKKTNHRPVTHINTS